MKMMLIINISPFRLVKTLSSCSCSNTIRFTPGVCFHLDKPVRTVFFFNRVIQTVARDILEVGWQIVS